MDSPKYYDRIREKIIKDRNHIIKQINDINGWKAYKSDGNFLMIEFPEGNGARLKQYLESNGFRVRFFDKPEDDPELDNFIRISLGTENENRRDQ